MRLVTDGGEMGTGLSQGSERVFPTKAKCAVQEETCDVQLLGYLEAAIKHPDKSNLREKGSI